MKISIITVCLNSASTIKDCIESVHTQSHNDIEHIMIDGVSTDGTIDIVKKNKKKISMFVSNSDKGIYYAMNKGINLASGDIVGILNSDDFYSNHEVLSTVAKTFQENILLEACYADLVYVEKNNISKAVRFWKSSQFKLGAFSKGWCPAHNTFFVRRSVYKRYGTFNIKYKIAADVELMMNFLEKKKINSKYISETWIKMRMGGTTNKNLKNIWKQNLEVLEALRAHGISYNLLTFIFQKLFSRIRQILISYTS